MPTARESAAPTRFGVVRHTLTTREFFDGERFHGPSLIEIVGGRIESLSHHDGEPAHALVSPGLVDLQMNGYDDVDIATCTRDEFRRLDARLSSAGTTSWLATIVTAPLPRLTEVIARLHGWITEGDTGCVGIHIEGPFLGAAPGAHNPKWIIAADLDWIRTLPSSVRVVTLAPEQQHSAQAVRELKQKGITVSIGHTRCTAAQFTSAVDLGASMVTHVFNGMSGVHHREDGVALSALTEDRVTTGLIGDGVHVSAMAAGLLFRSKWSGGVCLVSDSIGWQGQWAQKLNVQVRDGAPRLPDGTLAGSSTTMAECVSWLVGHAGVTLADALMAATSTPARVVGYPQLGRCRVGETADLVCFDEHLHVSEVHRRLVSQRGSQTD